MLKAWRFLQQDVLVLACAMAGLAWRAAEEAWWGTTRDLDV